MTNCYFCDKKITPKTTINLIDFYTNSYKACLECGKRENDKAERCQKTQNIFLAFFPWLFVSFFTGIITLAQGEFYDFYITFISQVGLAKLFYLLYTVLPTTPPTMWDLN
jgi:hypothetical protein